jgi:hypothetical protein
MSAQSRMQSSSTLPYNRLLGQCMQSRISVCSLSQSAIGFQTQEEQEFLFRVLAKQPWPGAAQA